MGYMIPYLATFSALLLMMTYAAEVSEHFLVVGQVIFDFGEESDNSSTYLIYDNMTAGIRIKYPSGWNVLEQLGNISGSSILVDFYNTGFNGTIGYSENANVVVSSPGGYSISSTEKSENSAPRGIQPAILNPAASDAIPDATGLLNEFTNVTVRILEENLNNFTLLESVSTIISGLPAHKITYTIAGNQSEVQQTQAWTFKDNKWYVVSYSAEPSAYFNPRTAQNILDSLLIE